MPEQQNVQQYFDQGELVSVLTTEPLDRMLDYKAPEGGVHLGAYVQVPLGPRQVIGVVWGKGRGGFDLKKARSVHRVLDVAPMRGEMRSFLEKCAGYTLTPLSQMLRLATRAPGLANPPSMQKVYRKGAVEPERMTDARRRVLQVFDDYGGLAFTQRELADHAGVTPTVIKGMVKLGAVHEEDTPRDLPFPRLSSYGFWCYLIGGVFVCGSLFFGHGPQGGWFMYPPLTGRIHSPGINTDFWLIGITFVEISAICAAVEFTVTTLLV